MCELHRDEQLRPASDTSKEDVRGGWSQIFLFFFFFLKGGQSSLEVVTVVDVCVRVFGDY